MDYDGVIQMTHDELLAKLNSYQCGSAFAEMFKNAVRAVVELHKSQDITLPNGEWGVNCSYCDILTYPCPTLEAIEKELK